MDTTDVHLKALLWYSGNAQLASTRRHLIRGLHDDELREVVDKAISREFARGALEEIAMTILDVTARDPVTVDGDGTGAAHRTSLKNERGQGGNAQLQGESYPHSIRFFELANLTTAEDEVMLDSAPLPATEQSAAELSTTTQSVSDQPSTGLLAFGKRPIRGSSGFEIHKRLRPNAPNVSARGTLNDAAASNNTVANPEVSAKRASLFCSTEQKICNKTVPFIEVVYRDIPIHSDSRWPYPGFQGDYYSFEVDEGLILKPLISKRFEKDYLSKEVYMADWGKYLRQREEFMASECCVNIYVIGKIKAACQYTIGDPHETACDRCINTKRLCARLVKSDDTIKLALFPLPKHLRPYTNPYALGYWVCE